MVFVHLLFAVVIGLILTVLLSFAFGYSAPGANWASRYFFPFVILFLVVWAGGLWLPALGPLVWGAPLISFLLAGVVVGLLFAVFAPAHKVTTPGQSYEQAREEQTESMAGALFWLFVVLLLIAAVAFYISPA